MNFRIPVTVIVATVLIAISFAMLFRWHIVSSSIGVHRLDRWTGRSSFARNPTERLSANRAEYPNARQTRPLRADEGIDEIHSASPRLATYPPFADILDRDCAVFSGNHDLCVV
jgi:hypothetical protein